MPEHEKDQQAAAQRRRRDARFIAVRKLELARHFGAVLRLSVNQREGSGREQHPGSPVQIENSAVINVQDGDRGVNRSDKPVPWHTFCTNIAIRRTAGPWAVPLKKRVLFSYLMITG